MSRVPKESQGGKENLCCFAVFRSGLSLLEEGRTKTAARLIIKCSNYIYFIYFHIYFHLSLLIFLVFTFNYCGKPVG